MLRCTLTAKVDSKECHITGIKFGASPTSVLAFFHKEYGFETEITKESLLGTLYC